MSRKTELIPLHSPAPGTNRHLRVFRYGEPGDAPKVYVHSSIHADEWPGLLVQHHLIQLLDDADGDGRIKGEIVLLPYANPLGMGQRVNARITGRHHLDGGGNFNRNWPDLTDTVAEAVKDDLGADTAENIRLIRSAIKQAVSALPRHTELDQLRAVLLELSTDADIVLDLHCDQVATFHVYANRVQHDDAMTLTRDLGSPVLLLEEAPGGGPFDEANHGPWVKLQKRFNLDAEVGRQCFSVTVELRGENDIDDAMARADAEGLLRFLMRKGAVEGDPGGLPAALCEATPLDGVDVPRAPETGLLVWRVNPGARVKSGDHLADLVEIDTDDPKSARHPVIAQTDGLMFARKSATLVRKGDRICKIAGKEPLAYRTEGGNLLSL